MSQTSFRQSPSSSDGAPSINLGTRIRIRSAESLHQKLQGYAHSEAVVADVPVHPNTWYGIELYDGKRVKMRKSGFTVISNPQSQTPRSQLLHLHPRPTHSSSSNPRGYNHSRPARPSQPAQYQNQQQQLYSHYHNHAQSPSRTPSNSSTTPFNPNDAPEPVPGAVPCLSPMSLSLPPMAMPLPGSPLPTGAAADPKSGAYSSTPQRMRSYSLPGYQHRPSGGSQWQGKGSRSRAADRPAKKRRPRQAGKTDSLMERKVMVKIGKLSGEVGMVKRSGHGFYCVHIPGQGEVMKRANELELCDSQDELGTKKRRRRPAAKQEGRKLKRHSVHHHHHPPFQSQECEECKPFQHLRDTLGPLREDSLDGLENYGEDLLSPSPTSSPFSPGSYSPASPSSRESSPVSPHTFDCDPLSGMPQKLAERSQRAYSAFLDDSLSPSSFTELQADLHPSGFKPRPGSFCLGEAGSLLPAGAYDEDVRLSLVGLHIPEHALFSSPALVPESTPSDLHKNSDFDWSLLDELT